MLGKLQDDQQNRLNKKHRVPRTRSATELRLLEPRHADVPRHPDQRGQLPPQRQDGAPRQQPRLRDRQPRAPLQPPLLLQRPRIWHLLYVVLGCISYCLSLLYMPESGLNMSSKT
jgi:hypothetical protein